jgi:hypothetical protein
VRDVGTWGGWGQHLEPGRRLAPLPSAGLSRLERRREKESKMTHQLGTCARLDDRVEGRAGRRRLAYSSGTYTIKSALFLKEEIFCIPAVGPTSLLPFDFFPLHGCGLRSRLRLALAPAVLLAGSGVGIGGTGPAGAHNCGG